MKKDNQKRVPELRFKGFDGDWEQRKLKNLFETQSRPIRMKDSSKYELVTVKRRNGGIVSRGQFRGKEVLVKSQFELRKGDFLISKRQVVHGATGIVPPSLDGAIVSNEYLVLRGNAELSTDFFRILSERPEMYRLYFLSSYGIDIEKLVFNVQTWMKKEILIPSLREQTAISTLIRTVDDTIALHERKLNLLKQLKKAYLQQLFPENGQKMPSLRFAGFTDDWVQRELRRIATFFSGGTPSVGNSQYYHGKIPFIRSAELNSENPELSITTEGLNNSSAKMVSKGDLLYALYGATSGEVGRAGVTGAINQAILAIKPNQGYETSFIQQWLIRSKGEITGTYLQGGQGNLSSAIIKKLKVAVPSLPEQEQISRLLQAIDKAISLHQRKLENLHHLKQAYLQKLFV